MRWKPGTSSGFVSASSARKLEVGEKRLAEARQALVAGARRFLHVRRVAVQELEASEERLGLLTIAMS